MPDIKEMLTEVRELAHLVTTYDQSMLPDGMWDQASDILTDFTADMPGAIGELLELSYHGAECPRPDHPCHCGYDAALAKLEGCPHVAIDAASGRCLTCQHQVRAKMETP